MVSDKLIFDELILLKNLCTDSSNSFQAGCLKNGVEFWKSHTSHPKIIELVTGMKIDIKTTYLPKSKVTVLHGQDKSIISNELSSLLKQGVVASPGVHVCLT